MNATSVDAFFQTTRTSDPKWVINASRQLVSIPANKIPLDYHPQTGEMRGMIVEPASQNYFIDSEGLQTGVQLSSLATRTSTAIAGSNFSINLPATYENHFIKSNISFSSDAVAISFFVKLSNNARPVVGYEKNKETTISLFMNDREINIASSDVNVEGPLSDNSYRVRVRAHTVTGLLSTIEIRKPIAKQVGMDISRIQVERNQWTSYIPTSGTLQAREAETIYRALVHNQEFNKHQGTFEVVYSPTPGSKGSAMSVLNTGWSDCVAVGHQYNEEGDGEILRFLSSSTFISVPLRVIGTTNKPNSGGRFSYSSYGIRGLIKGGDRVLHLKDYDSFMNAFFDRVHFGESYDGEHFAGIIHGVGLYARTFNESELINTQYTGA
jgi:hypothetical protein